MLFPTRLCYQKQSAYWSFLPSQGVDLSKYNALPIGMSLKDLENSV